MRLPRAGVDPASRVPGRVLLVLGWPLGLARTMWRYTWRTTPIHRREVPGGPADLPAAVPTEAFDDEVQTAADGVGPLLHRRYRVRVANARLGPEDVLHRFVEDPNWSQPGDVAVFVRRRGGRGAAQVGDEYVVRMPGPWNGPIRVVRRDAASVRFATLRGHLEAGQIEFRARSEDELLVFEIESWARCGDGPSHVLYSYLRLAKEVQLNLWLETCLTVAARSGGRAVGGVDVYTWRVDDPAPLLSRTAPPAPTPTAAFRTLTAVEERSGRQQGSEMQG